MMNAAHAREAPLSEPAPLPGAGLPGAHPVLSVMIQQQAPPAPQIPQVPQVPQLPAGAAQGMPPEARQAIAEAIREARQAAAQAREEARQAQEQVRVTVGDDEIGIVTPGEAQGGGIGRGGETIVYPGPSHGPFDNIPPQAFDLVLAFFFMIAFISVGTAVARAFGRRAENRPLQAPVSPELSAQLQRIEHAVEAMAIEVERISEAQRYMARLESERGADPALLARPGRRD